ncbi:hypothetical protein STREPTOSP366_08810 [Streptomyces variabilis]
MQACRRAGVQAYRRTGVQAHVRPRASRASASAVENPGLEEAAAARIVEGKHRPPIGDDGHRPDRPVPPPPPPPLLPPPACLVIDGKVVAFAEEERFSRRKHHKDSRSCAVAAAYCLSETGITLADVDEIAIAFNPAWPTPSNICTNAELIAELLAPALFGHHRPRQVTVVEHHLAHAVSAFHPSGFDEAAVLVVDGSGDGFSTTLAHSTADGLKVLRHSRSASRWAGSTRPSPNTSDSATGPAPASSWVWAATATPTTTPSISSPPAPAARREGAERRHRDGCSGTCHHQPGPGEGARRPCPGPAGAPQPRLTQGRSPRRRARTAAADSAAAVQALVPAPGFAGAHFWLIVSRSPGWETSGR